MKYVYCGGLVIGQLLCIALNSQSYFSSSNNPEPELLWEIGGAAGVMNCLTDIGGKNGLGKKFIKDINWNQTQFCGSFFVSAAWRSQYAIRLQATAGQIAGNDDVLKNSNGVARSRYLRNLQFRTNIIEIAVLSEWHVRTLLNKNSDLPLFSPYLVAGAGCFNYHPQALLNHVWVDLRPLHTEGEGFKEYPGHHEYKTFSWCIPMGIGLKYDAAKLVNLRFEILYRCTGTDYLDDVSSSYIDPLLFSKYLSPTAAAMAVQLADRSEALPGGVKNSNNAIRGNPTNKDAFFSCMLTVSIALGRAQRK